MGGLAAYTRRPCWLRNAPRRTMRTMTCDDREPCDPASSDRPRKAASRASRLMALAIEMQRLIDEGVVRDYAELARLEHVSRARITQIMDLLHLAPDLQERVLFLAPVTKGRARVTERKLRPVAACSCWHEQRAVWARLFSNPSS